MLVFCNRFRFGSHGGFDPSGFDAGIHDDGFGIFAGQFETIQETGMADCFIVLAFAPADQIVGGATGQILDAFYIVLAQCNQYRGGDTGNRFQRVLDAQSIRRRALVCTLTLFWIRHDPFVANVV